MATFAEAGVDEATRDPAPARPMSALDEARAALGLLTIVPIGRRALPEDASAGAAPWFPLIGGLVGVVAAAAYALGETLLGGFYGAALALTAAAILTGALHHDGLADMADGLGVRGDAARRLAVMRDSAIGTYGTLALVAYALLCVAALTPLAAPDAASAIVCGHVLGRWAALVQLALVAPARARRARRRVQRHAAGARARLGGRDRDRARRRRRPPRPRRHRGRGDRRRRDGLRRPPRSSAGAPATRSARRCSSPRSSSSRCSPRTGSRRVSRIDRDRPQPALRPPLRADDRARVGRADRPPPRHARRAARPRRRARRRQRAQLRLLSGRGRRGRGRRARAVPAGARPARPRRARRSR